MKTAVIVLSHGSRADGAGAVGDRIIAEIKKRGGSELVIQAFLQHSKPDLVGAIDSCAGQGADRIIIVPFFMQSGAHVVRDIPELIERARKSHPGVEILSTGFVGSHPLMTDIVLDLIGDIEKGRKA